MEEILLSDEWRWPNVVCLRVGCQSRGSLPFRWKGSRLPVRWLFIIRSFLPVESPLLPVRTRDSVQRLRCFILVRDRWGGRVIGDGDSMGDLRGYTAFVERPREKYTLLLMNIRFFTHRKRVPFEIVYGLSFGRSFIGHFSLSPYLYSSPLSKSQIVIPCYSSNMHIFKQCHFAILFKWSPFESFFIIEGHTSRHTRREYYRWGNERSL